MSARYFRRAAMRSCPESGKGVGSRNGTQPTLALAVFFATRVATTNINGDGSSYRENRVTVGARHSLDFLARAPYCIVLHDLSTNSISWNASPLPRAIKSVTHFPNRPHQRCFAGCRDRPKPLRIPMTGSCFPGFFYFFKEQEPFEGGGGGSQAEENGADTAAQRRG